jgi:Zn-finger nucleic acid-binding protein
MTPQDRPHAQPSKIRAMELTCRKCKASISLTPSSREYVPEVCPYCKAAWFQRGSQEAAHLAKLLQALHWLNGSEKDAPCDVHFEVTSLRP